MQSKRKPARAVGPVLQAALNASGFIGTWETDLETGIVHLSGPLASLLGVDPQRATQGVGLLDFLEGIHADDRDRVAELVYEAHSAAGRFEAEFRTIRIDDAIRWVAARGQVETGPDGRGLRCLGIAVDVTDTRQVDEADAERAVGVIIHLADTLIALREPVSRLDTPILKTLIDILLLEIGVELAKIPRHAQAQALH